MKHLSNLTELRVLRLSGAAISDEGMAHPNHKYIHHLGLLAHALP